MCKLVHLQLFARQSERADSSGREDRLEEKLRSHINPEWPTWLKEWRNPLTMVHRNKLTDQGKRDMQQLAYRDICRYKDVMTKCDNHTRTRVIANKRETETRRVLSEYSSAGVPR
jgi:hypothetical protein